MFFVNNDNIIHDSIPFVKSHPQKRTPTPEGRRSWEFYNVGLKLSFRLTLRLKTRWPSRLSLLSRQK